VSTQLEGTLTQVEIETATRVRAGQLLARLDDRLLRADLKQAEAALAHSTEQLNRVEQLAEKRLADQNRLQAAITQKRIDEVSVERLQTLLSLSSLHSPIDGVIISETRYPGEAVQKGAPLFSIADISRLKIVTKVPEPIARKLRIGSNAVARIDALGNREIRAAVWRIHPISDPASHQVTVELDAGSVFPTLQPGNWVTVAFASDTRKGALTLDRSAVPDITQESEIDLFRVNGDRAERRRVQLGLVLENRVEVINGLEEGDQVITGSGSLKDGDPVQLVGQATPAEDR
jgi:membrane fusion protein (multidrug efflux system)